MSVDEQIKEALKGLEGRLVNFNDFKIERTVGKGSYGEVCLCEHIPTKQRVAVKKLFLTELTGQNLLYFCREIKVLAVCRSPFLLQLLGFTVSVPYCIVTDYVPNGSLYDALRHAPRSPRLDGSRKTSIAMGIAAGMASLHQQNVMHRDLKSLNILLDRDLMPKICDFGISRFAEGPEATQNIGSPHWMAPEMFDQNVSYTNKVDVYAFGILLWEMFTEDVPWKQLKPVQIGMTVVQGKRPVIPITCPHELRDLIQICWHQDPSERPTFVEIYKRFEGFKVSFPGTEVNKVVESMQRSAMNAKMTPEKIDLFEHGLNAVSLKQAIGVKTEPIAPRSRAEAPTGIPSPLPPGPRRPALSPSVPPAPNSVDRSQDRPLSGERRPVSMNNGQRGPMILSSSRSEHQLSAFDAKPSMLKELKVLPTGANPAKRMSEMTKWEILSNLKSPDFRMAYEETVRSLTLDQADKFFRVILGHFRSQMPLDLLVVLVTGFATLVQRDRAFMDTFMQFHGHLYMPYDQPRIVEPLITLVCAAIAKRPEDGLIDGIRKLFANVKGHEPKMINILRSFPNLNSSLALNTFCLFATGARFFIECNETAHSYLDLMFNMCQKEPMNFGPYAIRVFGEALKARSRDTIIAAYQRLCAMQVRTCDVPLDVVVQQMSDPGYLPWALSLLTRLDTVPVSNRLAKQLIECSQEKASASLMVQIASKPNGAEVVMNNRGWLDPGRFAVTTQLEIILHVLAVKEQHRALLEDPRTPKVMQLAIAEGHQETVQRLIGSLRKVDFTREIIHNLSVGGFLKECVRVVFGSQNSESIRQGVLFFDRLARVCFVGEFLELVPYMPYVLRLPGQLPIYALSLVIVISYQPQAMQLLIKHNVPAILQSMQVPAEYVAYRTDFLERCKNCKSI